MLVILIGSSLTSDRGACFFDAPHFLELREGEVRILGILGSSSPELRLRSGRRHRRSAAQRKPILGEQDGSRV
jgi:hypothetical protein